MQQLDASVLREFVEKIYISEVYTPDENEPRIKVREIEIVYNFIGAFDFEDAREQSQAAQKEKKTGVAQTTPILSHKCFLTSPPLSRALSIV